ncbi:MAG: class I SAM-dependent methyltransferase, partial [Parapedobacter sp.]
MEELNRKQHWETVYETKSPDQVSWTQEVPKTSLDFIQSFGMDKTARIIDIGGGDSNLVDFLLDAGYKDITVLDISEKAIDRAKERLGDRAEKVNWIVSDVTEFEPDTSYDIWHDRAAFHFLTSPGQITKYSETVKKAVTGFVIVGTFSTNGPTKCSGLDIKQYDEKTLTAALGNGFDKLKC